MAEFCRIEDNDIFLNKLCGIEVRTGGNPLVQANRIYEGIGECCPAHVQQE